MSFWKKLFGNTTRTGVYEDGREIGYQEMVTGLLDALAKTYAEQNKLSIDEAQHQVQEAFKKAKLKYPNLFKSGGTTNISDLGKVAEYLLSEKN